MALQAAAANDSHYWRKYIGGRRGSSGSFVQNLLEEKPGDKSEATETSTSTSASSDTPRKIEPHSSTRADSIAAIIKKAEIIQKQGERETSPESLLYKKQMIELGKQRSREMQEQLVNMGIIRELELIRQQMAVVMSISELAHEKQQGTKEREQSPEKDAKGRPIVGEFTANLARESSRSIEI